MEQRLIFFKKQKVTFTLIFLIILALYAISSLITQYGILDGITAIPKAFDWIARKMVPTAKAISHVPDILTQLYQTFFLSVAVTVTAGIVAFLFALPGSNTTRISPIIRQIVRIIASFFRNVPNVVWALILLFSFGQNIMTGFLALFFYTFGLLTRAFIETIDEVSASCVEALTATGASYIQIVFQGIIPSSMAQIISWVLYMIETNIRDATLVGILTGTGIGFLFDFYFKRLDYASASIVVLSVVLIVIVIEMISNKVRKVIL